MKQRILAASLSLTLFLGISLPASASGIPVVDGTQVAQGVQQLAQWAQQIAEMKNQLDQMKQQYQSLTGARGFGDVLNNPALRNYLPQDWQKVYDSIQNGGYKGLDGTAKALADAAGLMKQCANYTDQNVKSSCEASAVQTAQNKSNLMQSLDAATQRLNQIQGLMNQIKNTNDPKGIAELQARIAGEQAMIQNEATRLQMYQMMTQANEKLAKEQARQAHIEANEKFYNYSNF